MMDNQSSTAIVWSQILILVQIWVHSETYLRMDKVEETNRGLNDWPMQSGEQSEPDFRVQVVESVHVTEGIDQVRADNVEGPECLFFIGTFGSRCHIVKTLVIVILVHLG